MGNHRNVCRMPDFLCAQKASNLEVVLFLSIIGKLSQLHLREPAATPPHGVGSICSSIPVFFHISCNELLGAVYQYVCLVLNQWMVLTGDDPNDEPAPKSTLVGMI
jgi:hypothetical protein